MNKRTFENLPPQQQASKRYWDSVAVGAFREVTCGDEPVALASVLCSSVCFTNTTGKTVGITRPASGGVIITLPNNSGKTFDVSANASELSAVNLDDADEINVSYECGGEVI